MMSQNIVVTYLTESVNDGGDPASHITDQQPKVCCGTEEGQLLMG
jgi:hypothetical protein